MAELIAGSVKINGKNQVGGLVLDEAQLLFFQRPASMGQLAGGAAGGLVGALVGMGVDKLLQKRREKNGEVKKTIETDPIYQSFDDKIKKQLVGVESYVAVRREEVGAIKETWAGFAFDTTQGLLVMKSKVKKKAMRQWLSEHGYNVPMN